MISVVIPWHHDHRRTYFGNNSAEKAIERCIDSLLYHDIVGDGGSDNLGQIQLQDENIACSLSGVGTLLAVGSPGPRSSGGGPGIIGLPSLLNGTATCISSPGRLNCGI